ncbi:hypothetical protein FQR65_LT12535 [Abscondita terminalis]|nr:hypothetical protein FQR65_LT12535 [Abscondita terminalis]
MYLDKAHANRAIYALKRLDHRYIDQLLYHKADTSSEIFQCEDSGNLIKCLKIRAMKMIMAGIKNENNSSLANKGKLHDELTSTLPRFLATSNINMESVKEEGRKKEKGGNGQVLILGLLGMKTVLVSLAFKAIAAIAGSALFIGKMALAFAAILGLQALTTHDETTFKIVNHKNYGSGEESFQEKMHRGYLSQR